MRNLDSNVCPISRCVLLIVCLLTWPLSAQTLWWEAESNIPEQAEAGEDAGASGGGYVALAQSHKAVVSSYVVEVTEAGEYQFLFRQTWPARALRYRWDDGAWIAVAKPVWLDREISGAKGRSWGWFTDGRFHRLSKGAHRLEMRLEPGGKDAVGPWYPRAGLDCFALSAESFAPVSTLTPATPVPDELSRRRERSARKLAFWSTARRLAEIYRADSLGRDGHVLPYRFLAPEKVEAGKRYPLVVCLPSSGGRGRDNVAQLGAAEPAKVLALPQARKQYPCFVLVPQAPDWFSDDPRPRVTKTGLPMLTLLLDLLDKLQADHPIDPDRVYLTGQSLGGFGVCNAMRRDADRFAAAVMVAGSTPGKGKYFASTPTWIFVGDRDARKGQAQATHKAILAAGGEAKLTILPGIGHVAWPKAYASRDLWRWLFAQERK